MDLVLVTNDKPGAVAPFIVKLILNRTLYKLYANTLQLMPLTGKNLKLLVYML